MQFPISQYPASYSQSLSSQYPTQMSSQYPPQTSQQMVPPPQTFRTEYQGILHGLNCYVNLMYAGISMIGYGKTFFSMSLSVIQTVSRAVVKVLVKLLGFSALRRLLDWLNKGKNTQIYQDIWNAGVQQGSTQGFMNKILLLLRILTLIGMGVSYILKRKLQQKIKLQQLKNSESQIETLSTIDSSKEIIESQEKILENEFQKEVDSQKDVFNRFRSEEFWNNNLPPKENENIKEDSIPIPEKNEIIENIPIIKEKISAPIGSKPWLTKKK